jgi:hypothetical protein
MVRKLKSAFFTTLILGVLFFLFELIQEGSAVFFILVLFYSAIGNFLFGIPISFLSDFLTKKLIKYRFIVTGFIHILFGFLTTLVIGRLGLFAGVCSLLFFLLEELQKKNTNLYKINRKMFILNGFITISFFSIGIYGFVNFNEPISEKKTNNIFLIPNGFEGAIVVYYNVSEESPIKKEGEFSVIPVNVENLIELEGTEIEHYGISFTSTPRTTEGATVNDKYYYVDEMGGRTKIDNYCTSGDGSGTFTTSSGKEIQYDTLQITKTDCGEDFYLYGKEMFNTQISEVQKHWSGKLSEEN